MAKEVKEAVVETTAVETATPASAEKTMKKGTILQAVKAIAVLVCICLVCGALLALCNDIFHISDEERARREEAKINASLAEVYPELTNPQSLAINGEYGANAIYGSIKKVVRSEDGTYIIAAEGIGGYGGSITVLVVIGTDAKIINWKISDVGGETYANNVMQHTDWYKGEEISTDIEFMKHGGATMTSTALNNAIKMASYYAMNVLNLGENFEGDARKAVADKLAATAYADYTFTTVADNKDYMAKVLNGIEGAADGSYYFVGTKAGENDIEVYALRTEEGIDVVVLRSGLIHSARIDDSAILFASEPAEENAERVAQMTLAAQTLSYFEYGIQGLYANFQYDGMEEVNDAFKTDETYGYVNKIYKSADGAKIYEATGRGDFGKNDDLSGLLTINVVIKDNKVQGWSYVGTTTGDSYMYMITNKYNDAANPTKDWYKDSDISAPIEMGSNKVSGASRSSTAINNAVNMVALYIRNTSAQQGGSN